MTHRPALWRRNTQGAGLSIFPWQNPKMIEKSAENDLKMGCFQGGYSDAPEMRVLSSLNNESWSPTRRARTAFWRFAYMALIPYKGMKQNAPERPPDALKRKPHFQEHSSRENPLAKHTPQAVYLTFWGVFACALEWLFMCDHINALGRVWGWIKESPCKRSTCKGFKMYFVFSFSYFVIFSNSARITSGTTSTHKSTVNSHSLHFDQ